MQFLEKNLVSINMAVLSRGCKPRVSRYIVRMDFHYGVIRYVCTLVKCTCVNKIEEEKYEGSRVNIKAYFRCESTS